MSKNNGFLNIVVCGTFHYKYYVEHLDRLGVLLRYYFSGRVFRSPKFANAKSFNWFLKEYLLGLHIKFFGGRFLDFFMPAYHFVWRFGLFLFFRPARVNIFMLHGNCIEAIKRTKSSGGIVIGEAVNSHPYELDRKLKDECNRLGLGAYPRVMAKEKIVQEAALVDYLLAPSREVADSYIRNGFPSSHVVVIPYGCPVVKRAKVNNESSDRFRVLLAGSVSLRKGHHLFLDALLLLPGSLKDKLDIVFVGRSDSKYLECLHRFNVQFTHCEHLPHHELLALMAKSSLTVLPSVEDGFGMVVTESISMGVPVIVSKYAGASELVRAIGGGIVIDPFDSKEFARALENVLCGDFSVSLSGELPTWESYAVDLLEAVQRLPRLSQ